LLAEQTASVQLAAAGPQALSNGPIFNGNNPDWAPGSFLTEDICLLIFNPEMEIKFREPVWNSLHKLIQHHRIDENMAQKIRSLTQASDWNWEPCR
jgi:hypothetical protein